MPNQKQVVSESQLPECNNPRVDYCWSGGDLKETGSREMILTSESISWSPTSFRNNETQSSGPSSAVRSS